VRGAFHFRKGGFFCTHSFCAAPTQQYWFCLSTALSAVVLPYQRLNSCRFRIPLFDSSLLCWLTSLVLIQFFFQKIQVTAYYHFIHMVAWGHQAHIRGSSAVSFRLSACPSWVRLCRICLFGLRLVRAGFGYAEQKLIPDLVLGSSALDEG
jgi:hypothetical protein